MSTQSFFCQTFNAKLLCQYFNVVKHCVDKMCFNANKYNAHHQINDAFVSLSSVILCPYLTTSVVISAFKGALNLLWLHMQCKAPFTPRTITLKRTIKITIIVSTPTDDIICKHTLICCFNFSSSLQQDWFWLAVNVCILHQLEKLVSESDCNDIIYLRLCCYICGVDSAIL